MFYKSFSKGIYLISISTTIGGTVTYNLRNNDDYRTQRCRLQTNSKSFFPSTIKLWNFSIVYHVVRLPVRFKQGELKVSRHMYFEWSTRFVFK
jgi:hypothetical protein